MRIVASLVLLLASCTACGATAGVTVPFATLAKGLNSGIREPTQVVVRTQSEWATLWGRHMRTRTAPPPPPAIDFSKEMVVALFMGERPTGGYEIEVTRAERIDTSLEVRFRTRKPEPGAMQMQVLTQPFHLIRLPRVDGSLTFIGESPSG